MERVQHFIIQYYTDYTTKYFEDNYEYVYIKTGKRCKNLQELKQWITD